MERPLWAEQRPENWWDAAQQAMRGVLRKQARGARSSRHRAFGPDARLTLLDKDDEVDPSGADLVRPAQPGASGFRQRRRSGIEKVLAYTANPVVTGFTLPKLLWVRDNEPANFERVRKVLLPKDYMRFKLTGEYASEVSDASGTSLFDVVKRDWSYDMCGRARPGPRRFCPPCYESSEVSGKIIERPSPQSLGLSQVRRWSAAAATRRQARSATALSRAESFPARWEPRGVVFAHMDQPALRSEGAFTRSATRCRSKWHVMGVTQGAGLSLQWFRNQSMPGEDYSAADTEAATRRARIARSVLAAVSDGRAHAASGCDRARGLGRTDGEAHARRSDPVGHRRRVLQPEGRAGHHRRDGRAGGVGPAVGRWRAQSVSGGR